MNAFCEVFNIAQTLPANWNRLRSASVDVGHKASRLAREHVMSKSGEFRQHAEEAIFWARHSRTDAQRKLFLDMARSWTQAAERSESPVVVKELPPEPRAA